MACRQWLIGLLILMGILIGGAAQVAAAPPEAPLYLQVAGSDEEYVVQRKETLTFLALKKGVRWSAVAERNDLEKPYRLKPGMVLQIDTTHIVPAELTDGLVINLPELLLYHFQGGAYQRRYALAVGRRSWPTPTGDYHIRNKARNPTWVVPASIQEEMEREGKEVLERVPPGPKNPLGAFWMGTSAPGVGLHATNRPWSVGHSVSHGCIRMLPDEIEALFPQVAVGTPIKIIYRPVKLALTPEGRIYLEAHPNIYRAKLNYLELVQEAARRHQLQDRIDWELVGEIVQDREGVAYDITKGPGDPRATATAAEAPVPTAGGLNPLQGKETKLE